jgi:hypothetical protein
LKCSDDGEARLLGGTRQRRTFTGQLVGLKPKAELVPAVAHVSSSV